MVSPDWKPEKRLRNPDVLRKFRLEHLGEPCFRCEQRMGVHVHHTTFRSQGGSDTEDNLEMLCIICHDAAHGVRSF